MVFSLMTPEEMMRSINRYFELYREQRFYQQTERSVMTHIAQVSAKYHYVYQCVGDFPDDEETALEFNLRLNDILRSRKDELNTGKPAKKYSNTGLKPALAEVKLKRSER